jgi:predicted O-methyltransferase YrrM
MNHFQFPVIFGVKLIRKVRFYAARFFLIIFDRERAKQANSIFTHLTNEEKYILFRLAKTIPKCGVAVEIGSYLGASSCFLAMGISKQAGRLYCIDTWQNESMTEGLRDTFIEFSDNIALFRDNIIPIRGRSEVIGAEFKEKISLLFLDGNHSYEAVSRDFFTWLPHLKDQAVVVLHDCGWAEGVKRLIAQEVRPRAFKWREVSNMAWGRLKKDKQKCGIN